jgi:predicted enzyme related to lactoylglutathione lyase
MVDARPRGRFVWHDLMTKDPPAAIEFYKKVVGWGTQEWNGPTPYTMWTADNTPIGGVMAMPAAENAPPHWLGYVSTPDVDATVAEATRRGASTHVPPTDIPTVGRFAVLMDPQGASFAVFTSTNQSAAGDDTPKQGDFSWHELATTDPVAAFDFYQALFGWEKTSAMDMGDMGVYQMFGLNGVPFGGVFKKSAEMPGPPSWAHYIKIADVQRAVDVVKNNGGQVLNGPMEVPGGDWIANCMDPQGGVFAVHAVVAKT